jgi:hypothetical protein
MMAVMPSIIFCGIFSPSKLATACPFSEPSIHAKASLLLVPMLRVNIRFFDSIQSREIAHQDLRPAPVAEDHGGLRARNAPSSKVRQDQAGRLL